MHIGLTRLGTARQCGGFDTLRACHRSTPADDARTIRRMIRSFFAVFGFNRQQKTFSGTPRVPFCPIFSLLRPLMREKTSKNRKKRFEENLFGNRIFRHFYQVFEELDTFWRQNQFPEHFSLQIHLISPLCDLWGSRRGPKDVPKTTVAFGDPNDQSGIRTTVRVSERPFSIILINEKLALVFELVVPPFPPFDEFSLSTAAAQNDFDALQGEARQRGGPMIGRSLYCAFVIALLGSQMFHWLSVIFCKFANVRVVHKKRNVLKTM